MTDQESLRLRQLWLRAHLDDTLRKLVVAPDAAEREAQADAMVLAAMELRHAFCAADQNAMEPLEILRVYRTHEGVSMGLRLRWDEDSDVVQDVDTWGQVLHCILKNVAGQFSQLIVDEHGEAMPAASLESDLLDAVALHIQQTRIANTDESESDPEMKN